jgi:hypothetical protein
MHQLNLTRMVDPGLSERVGQKIHQLAENNRILAGFCS